MITDIDKIKKLVDGLDITLADYYQYASEKFTNLVNEFAKNSPLYSSYTIFFSMYSDHRKTMMLSDMLLIAKRKELESFVGENLSSSISKIYSILSGDKNLYYAFQKIRNENITSNQNQRLFYPGYIDNLAADLPDVYMKIILDKGEYAELIKEYNQSIYSDPQILTHPIISSEQSPIKKCVCNELYKTITNLVDYMNKKKNK